MPDWVFRAAGSKRDGEPAEEVVHCLRFEYPESTGAPFVPAWDGWEGADAAAVAGGASIAGSVSASSGAVGGRAEPPEDLPDADAGSQPPAPELARQLGEERERAFDAGFKAGFDAGFEAGRRQGIEQARETQAQAAGQRLAQLTAALNRLAGERDSHLQALEPEVVRLAIAIAARILRREAAVDPLLLSSAVRAALGQIAAAAEVRLRVPAAELDLWKEAMAAVPNLAVRPAVVAGEGMQLGDCVVETALGTADLGIGAQLAEIERVLLLEEPATAAAGNSGAREKAFPRSGV